MSGDILFDNLVISDDESVVRDWAAQTYDLKRKQIDRQSVSNVDLYFSLKEINETGSNIRPRCGSVS